MLNDEILMMNIRRRKEAEEASRRSLIHTSSNTTTTSKPIEFYLSVERKSFQLPSSSFQFFYMHSEWADESSSRRRLVIQFTLHENLRRSKSSLSELHWLLFTLLAQNEDCCSCFKGTLLQNEARGVCTITVSILMHDKSSLKLCRC